MVCVCFAKACFPPGLCGMLMRLQCPSGHGHISQLCSQRSLAALCVINRDVICGCKLSWTQMLLLIFALSIFFFLLIFFLNYFILCPEMPFIKMVTLSEYLKHKDVWPLCLLARSMDIVKKGFLALEKCYFSASKEEYLKNIQNCKELNWFLLKVGTNLIVKEGFLPLLFSTYSKPCSLWMSMLTFIIC